MSITQPLGELKTSTECIDSLGIARTKVLTISNPGARNALSPGMYASAVEALNHADSSAEVRSIILTGEGSHFCGGGNLQRLLDNRHQPRSVQAQSIDQLHHWIEAIRVCRKPVIAAVEGACAGAGFSLALACDFIVAASDAVFVMAYANVALSPDGGGSWHITRSLPRATASQLLLGGERMGGERMHHLGIVSHLANSGQAYGQALELAAQLNSKAPNALASIKELMSDAQSHTLHEHLQHEREAFVENLHHDHGAEGIHAFLNKRPANYR